MIITRPREVIPHSIDRRTEKVLAALVNNPALQIHMILGRILAVGEADRTRRVVLESLAYDGIDTGTALADELVLAGGEVVVAGPAWGGVLVWDGELEMAMMLDVGRGGRYLRVVKKLNPLRRSLW